MTLVKLDDLVIFPYHVLTQKGEANSKRNNFFDKGVCSEMLDLSWKVFSHTGNLDTYLLIKELERDSELGTKETPDANDSELSIDSPSK